MKPEQIKLASRLLLALVAVLVIMYIFKWVKRKFQELESSNAVSTDSIKAKTVALVSCSQGNTFPLKTGSCGTNVSKLQTSLNQYGKAGLKVDGNFGVKTKNALMAYNGKTSITQTELRNYINANTKTASTSGGTSTSTSTSGGNTGSWGGSGSADTSADSSPDYFSDSAEYPTSITDYAVQVKTDLDTWYMLGGRKNEGIWSQMVMLSAKDLKMVADYISATYGESLYAMILRSRWDITDNVDVQIKNKLIAAGAGPSK